MVDETTTNPIETTVQIVTAYVGRHQIAASELQSLIGSVYAAMNAGSAPAAAPEPFRLTPAQIRRSVTPDAIMSFEDQRPYSVLKRHLTHLGLTPAQYRMKWGLPPDYPMTAASYSARRSALALKVGLGRKRAAAAPKTVSEPVAPAKSRSVAETDAKLRATRKPRTPKVVDPGSQPVKAE